MDKDFKSGRAVIYWLYLGIAMVLIMVVIGGMTRLTHSGLSMVHWSFTGSLPPMNDGEWTAEFERYQQSPEFREVHSHFTLDDFKSIYWWEYIHRLFGRTIGVVFIVPFLFFLFTRRIPRALLPQFILLLGLGAFQAFLGWFMVKSGLIDVPRVSHFRLAAHLTTAFVTCACILWVALQYHDYGRVRKEVLPVRKHAYTLGALLLLQIIYGAFVAGLRAGWVHNTWPLMDGDLVSPAVWAMQPVIDNFLEGRSGVQFIHRTLAIGILLYAVVIWTRTHHERRIAAPVKLVSATITLQFLLGISTLLLHVPISLAVLHQVCALLVLLAVTWLLYRTTYRPVHVNDEIM